jgi:hypothetical protein
MERPLPFRFAKARECLCLWTLFLDLDMRSSPKCSKAKRLFHASPFWEKTPILDSALLILRHGRHDQCCSGSCGGPQGKIISCEGSKGSSGINHDGLHGVAARV